MLIRGELREVKKDTQAGGYRLTGRIYGDKKGIFNDGTPIYTSYIKEEKPDNVFVGVSGNSYKVTSWAKS